MIRVRNIRRRLLGTLSLVPLLSIGIMSSSSAATPAGESPRSIPAPVIEPVGSVAVPWYEGIQSGVFNVFTDPDSEYLYAVTSGYILQVDLSTFAVVSRIDLAGGVSDSVLGADGASVFVVGTAEHPVSTELTTYVQGFDLASGASVGSPVWVDGSDTPDNIVVDESGTSPIAYVLDGSYFGGPSARLYKVDLDTGVAVANDVDGSPFFLSYNTASDLALSADGSELYMSRPYVGAVPVQVVDTASLDTPGVTVKRTIGSTGAFLAVRDVPGSTLGHLYVADGTNPALTVYDLDDGDTVLSTTTLTRTDVRSLVVDTDGNAAVGNGDPVMEYVPAGSGQGVSTDFSDFYVGQGLNGMGSLGITIDPDETFGTCVFTANNTDYSMTAFSLDGADCGPFRDRFGEPPASIEIDDSGTVGITPPTPTEREGEWVAIGIFVDGVLADVLEPPFGTSVTVNWADLPPGIGLELRAYSQTHLDSSGGLTVDEIDATTQYRHSTSTRLGYYPLIADQVTAGEAHSCALAEGVVSCWGGNGSGQIGDGTEDDAPVPVPVAAVAGGFTNSDVTAVSAGYEHTCAVEGGVVYCWGSDGDYQSGGDGEDDFLEPRRIPDVQGGFTNANVTAVAAGEAHTCVIASGTVYCWGANGDGQLGQDVSDSQFAVEVADNDGFVNGTATALTAGANHTCAISADMAYCWGYNEEGQLGNGLTDSSPVPVAVSLPSASTISAGEEHTCAVSAGVVHCWGVNEDGQLGDDSGSDSTTPVAVVPGDGTFSNADIAGVAAGAFHSCALTADGSVWCWGLNDDGQLGTGDTSGSSVPVLVVDGSMGFSNLGVGSVAAGVNHTCALVDGAVYCWGDNGDQQMGAGLVDDLATAPTPVCCGGEPVASATAPVVGPVTGSDRRLTVAFTAPADDGGSEITNYEYSTDGGVTWRALDPASTASPAVLTLTSSGGTALVNGTTYQIQLRAVTSAGAGAASASVPGTPVLAPVPDPGGSLPTLGLGQRSAFENGVAVPTSVRVVDGSRLVMTGGSFEFSLSGACASVNCTVKSDGSDRIWVVFQDRALVSASGSGFLPGSTVHLWLMSDPVYLGSATVGSDGRFSTTLTLSGVAIGTHTLQATGLASSGEVRTLNLGVEVGAVGTLPATGRNVSLPAAWAVLLVVLGMGVSGLGRRKVL